MQYNMTYRLELFPPDGWRNGLHEDLARVWWDIDPAVIVSGDRSLAERAVQSLRLFQLRWPPDPARPLGPVFCITVSTATNT